MKKAQIEAWTLGVVERLLKGEQVEDGTIECKGEWPRDPPRFATRLAALANHAAGEPVLVLIGVDEAANSVTPVSREELADWWPKVRGWFDGPFPALHEHAVTTSAGTVVALQFDTEEAPYVVTRPGGGLPEKFVPYRDGTTTRAAHRRELIQMLSARINEPRVEILEAFACAAASVALFRQAEPRKGAIDVTLFLSIPPGSSASIPFHSLAASVRCGNSVTRLDPVWLSPDRYHARAAAIPGPQEPTAGTPRHVHARFDHALMTLDGPAAIHLQGFHEWTDEESGTTWAPSNELELEVTVEFDVVGLEARVHHVGLLPPAKKTSYSNFVWSRLRPAEPK